MYSPCVFWHEGRNVRVLVVDDSLWWIARDIAAVLGCKPDSKGMFIEHVPEKWKAKKLIRTRDGVKEMLCLSEQGVYFFLECSSDNPKAAPFRQWIAKDMVLSIRIATCHELAAEMMNSCAYYFSNDNCFTQIDSGMKQELKRWIGRS